MKILVTVKRVPDAEATIKVNPDKGTGALKGVSIVEFVDNAVPTVVTCKLKFKRVSTTVAKFTGCQA